MTAGEVEPGEAVFLDSSLVVAAAVEAHPSHQAAALCIDRLMVQDAELYISPQICREFLVVLTRQPVSGRSFTVEEALASLHAWNTACTLLEATEAVHEACITLARRFGVMGKQIHDCNIVATMKTHGIQRLATRNPSYFKRFAGEVSILAVVG